MGDLLRQVLAVNTAANDQKKTQAPMQDAGDRDSRPAGDEGVTLTSVVAGATKVLAPTAVITAILYYFGWARTNAAAEAVGTDQSLFGFTTTDYLIRSVAPLIRPIGLTLLAITVVVIASGFASREISERVKDGRISGKAVEIATAALLAGAVAAIIAGAVGIHDPQGQRPAHLSAYLLVGGAGLLLASLTMARLVPENHDGQVTASLHEQRAWVIGVAVALVLIATFAIVVRLAYDDGTNSIQSFVDGMDDEPQVVLTSERPLDIEYAGVSTNVYETSDGAAPRYQYDGLRLLLEANDRLFLVTDGYGTTAPVSALIVVPKSADLRIDFVQPPNTEG